MKKRIIKVCLLALVTVMIATCTIVGLAGCSTGVYNFMNVYGESKETWDNLKDNEYEYSKLDELTGKDYQISPVLETNLFEVTDNAGKVGLYDIYHAKWLRSPAQGATVATQHVSQDIYVTTYTVGDNSTSYLSDGTLLGEGIVLDEYSVESDVAREEVILRKGLDNDTYRRITISLGKKYGFKVDDDTKDLKRVDDLVVSQNVDDDQLAYDMGMKGYSVHAKTEGGFEVISTYKDGMLKSVFDEYSHGNMITMQSGKILYAQEIELPNDAKDFDLVSGSGSKYSYQLYAFDMKTGKSKEVKTKYRINANGMEYDDMYNDNRDIIVTANKINKDKTLGEPVILAVNGKGVVKDISSTNISAVDDIEPISKDRFIGIIDEEYVLLDKYLNIIMRFGGVNSIEVDYKNGLIFLKNAGNKWVVTDHNGKLKNIDMNGVDDVAVVNNRLLTSRNVRVEAISQTVTEYKIYNPKNMKYVGEFVGSLSGGLAYNNRINDNKADIIDIYSGETLFTIDALITNTISREINIGNGKCKYNIFTYAGKVACYVGLLK